MADYVSGVMDINANVPSERSNEDIVINKYGKRLLKILSINTGLKIANGRIYMFNDNVIAGRYAYYPTMVQAQ